jgi:hypothetical protein
MRQQLFSLPLFLLLLLFAIVVVVQASPMADADADAAAPYITCYTTSGSPSVSNMIGAENYLKNKGGECWQGDIQGCQVYANYNGARIMVCGYPLWHAPCKALATIASKVREKCQNGGKVSGSWTFFGEARVVIGT